MRLRKVVDCLFDLVSLQFLILLLLPVHYEHIKDPFKSTIFCFVTKIKNIKNIILY